MITFKELEFKSYLWKGQLHEAVSYLREFEGKKDLLHKYINVFEEEQYYKRTDNEILGKIDEIYQNYYRNVFWKNIPNEDAGKILFKELWAFCGFDTNRYKDKALEYEIGKIVNLEGYEYLGGKTQGFYGPYIWKDSTKETYEVELPSGIELYTIVMMDGFISRSWLDFISFGSTGPGGWVGQDGTLHCVRSVYNMESDEFNNSFLKHEAQHAYDKKKYSNITALDLEYRAKLVELIYWDDDKKIKDIYMEADNSNKDNSHTVASYKIISEMSQRIFGCEYINNEKMWGNKLDSIKRCARGLLDESSKSLNLGSMVE